MPGAYPKILHIGDKQILDLFESDVEITEKVDGSQFGFGKIDGELVCRSKGKVQDLDVPDKMFKEGVEYVRSIEERIPNNHFFHGEYLQKPRHSTLAYNRIPKNHIALFGVTFPDNSMGEYKDIEEWAETFDVESVPLLHHGPSSGEEVIKLVEDRESFLGGQNIEGVVVKKYEDWMFLGKMLLPVKAGKYVTEKFKEVHQKDWKRLNTGKGKLDALKDKYRSEARWEKAIMRLKEADQLEESPRDIGNLIKSVKQDLLEEEKDNIKDDLYKIFGGDLTRHATVGLPEWYKQRLVRGGDE